MSQRRPVFTFSFPGGRLPPLLPVSYATATVQQKQTTFVSCNSCSDFFRRAVLRLKVGQIDSSLKIPRMLLSFQTKYLRIYLCLGVKNRECFWHFVFWFHYSHSTITNHLKLREYVRTCISYLPAKLEVKTAREKGYWNVVQTTI